MSSLKSCTAWLSWNNKYDYDGTIGRAIQQFNDTIANIVPFIGVQLEDTVVRIDDCDQNDSGCSCSTIDGGKVLDKSSPQKAVKVKEVNLGSFGHGFGLREHDIILTVNDRRVESADMAIYLLNECLAGVRVNKNSKLALEIQRKESGLIRLDNQGDEILFEEIEDADLICISSPDQLTIYRLKNLKFRKYLRVTNGKICLSRRGTAAVQTQFLIYQFQRYKGEIDFDRFVLLQHKTSGQCIFVENGLLILKDKPAKMNKLPRDSGFLFNLKSNSNDDTYIETVTSPNMAIGFERRAGEAVLLPVDPSNKKELFNVFKDNRN